MLEMWDDHDAQTSVHVDENEIASKTAVKGGESITFGCSNDSIILDSCDPHQACHATFEPYAEKKRKVVNKLIAYLNSTLLNNNTSAQSKVLREWAKYVHSSISDDQIRHVLT